MAFDALALQDRHRSCRAQAKVSSGPSEKAANAALTMACIDFVHPKIGRFACGGFFAFDCGASFGSGQCN
jgi:hypothetical protein